VAYGILLGVSGIGGGASFVSTISTSSDLRFGKLTTMKIDKNNVFTKNIHGKANGGLFLF